MRKLFDRFKASHLDKRKLRLQRWELEREKGQTRYVLQRALTWAVLMTAIRDVYEQLFYGSANSSNLWGYLITYSLLGLFMGYSAWSSQEGAYRQARLNRRLQIPFDERIKSR